MSIAPHTFTRRCAAMALTMLGLAFAALAPSAYAGVANRGLPHASRSNPLAGRPWLGNAGQLEFQRALGLAASTPF